ncbi:MAG: LCP family protein [bacterium]|nr:LCP family protein [bacterium]
MEENKDTASSEQASGSEIIEFSGGVAAVQKRDANQEPDDKSEELKAIEDKDDNISDNKSDIIEENAEAKETKKTEKRIPWYRRIPTAGRFIVFSTFVFIIAYAVLVGGFWYIRNIPSVEASGGSVLSEVLGGAIIPNPGERVFKGRDRMNILCLGIDYNRDEKGIGYTKGARSDTIFVLSVDSKGKILNVLSIPRDTYVFIGEEYGYDKINSAYSYGGIELAEKVISNFLGVPIDHYVIVKVAGAGKMVDALGGLQVDVEKDMDYDDNWGNLHIHLKAGKQQLNGEQAVGYARFRMDAESDRGRIRRQQQLMGALLKRLKDPMVILRLQGIVRAISENIETDFDVMDLLDLTYLYKDFDRQHMKTGAIVGDDTDINGASCIIPYEPENVKTIMELLKDPSDLSREDVCIEVLNGCGEDGTAGEVAEMLRSEGFRVINAEKKADHQNYEVTKIIDRLGSRAMRSALENLLVGCDYELDLDSEDNQTITVIVGRDRTAEARSRARYGDYSGYGSPTFTEPPHMSSEEIFDVDYPTANEPEPSQDDSDYQDPSDEPAYSNDSPYEPEPLPEEPSVAPDPAPFSDPEPEYAPDAETAPAELDPVEVPPEPAPVDVTDVPDSAE